MLDKTPSLLSFDELKNLLLHELTIFHIAIAYVLIYVVYKALGRYIYFKPQEHASKFNRTFLTLSILIVLINSLNEFTSYLPILPEYRWLYVLCGLVILIAPLSIIMHRTIWKYSRDGQIRYRDWHSRYLPISEDYYKTSIPKSEQNGNTLNDWEEEGVKSTDKNIHSDVLLNILALTIFISVSAKWTYNSAAKYGWLSYIFSIVICLTISSIFFDRSVFSWIEYLENNFKKIIQSLKSFFT